MNKRIIVVGPSGKQYDGQYIMERPCGKYGSYWCTIQVFSDLGAFFEAYESTSKAAHQKTVEQLQRAGWKIRL